MTLTRLLFGAWLLLQVSNASANGSPSAPDLYERGFSHYKLGEFEAAIVDFKAAYAIEPSSMLLFNIAQSHRQLGDDKRARFFYREFVHTAPPSAARADAERFLAILDREGAAPVPSTPVPPSASSPVAVLAPVSASAVQPPRLRVSRRGAVALVASTAALGASFLAGGTGLSIHAAKTADALEHAALETTWDAAQRARYDEGRASSSASIALFAVGGVALTASVISAIVLRGQLVRRRAQPVHASLARLSWTF